ncbi:hypothetical protein ACUXZZ_45505 (plasmid) [Streptomyces graminifolii]|uniref:hypothetical protein n=1 Tax=Streptomyces graminifolii TaxID=1266771 RepID=UPI004059EF58
MASRLGSHVTIDCPICPEPVDLPLQDHGVDFSQHPHVVNLTLDVRPLHDHVAATHRKTEAT